MKETEKQPSPAHFDLRDPAALLATGFGVGLLPGAPGTWASLAALPFAWGLQAWGGPAALAAGVVVATAIGIWATGRVIGGSVGDDPGQVVIDEIAGQWLTLLFVHLDPMLFLAGFLLFRIADILKPWPVSWADRAVGGALGVMLDDLLAAIYAGAVLAVLAWWIT